MAAGEVHEDADDADNEPEEKVLVAEGDGEDEAHQRDGFTDGAGDDQPRLDVAHFAFENGLLLRPLAQKERDGDVHKGENAEKQNEQRIFAEHRLDRRAQDAGADDEDHPEEHHLRHQENEPEDHHRPEAGVNFGCVVLHSH